MSNSARNDKEIRQEMVVIGGGGGSDAVSSQFHIVYTHYSHHTKGEPWNSLMKTITPVYRQILIKTASPPPPPFS